jgi:hypothetical protein
MGRRWLFVAKKKCTRKKKKLGKGEEGRNYVGHYVNKNAMSPYDLPF